MAMVLTKNREDMANRTRNKLAGLSGHVSFLWFLHIRREKRQVLGIPPFSAAPQMMSWYLGSFPSFY